VEEEEDEEAEAEEEEDEGKVQVGAAPRALPGIQSAGERYFGSSKMDAVRAFKLLVAFSSFYGSVYCCLSGVES